MMLPVSHYKRFHPFPVWEDLRRPHDFFNFRLGERKRRSEPYLGHF